MVLTINISNDLISYGIFHDRKCICAFNSNRTEGSTSDEHILFIRSMLSIYGINLDLIKGCCVASVVPSSVNAILKSVKTLFNIDPIIVGHGIKTGINIKIDNHSQLGADLVSNVSGCRFRFKPPYIIVDFGLATTLSYVNEKNEFEGAIISAGVKISSLALSNYTASLPHISVSSPKNLIGKNTIDSMLSGCIYGTACSIDGLVNKIKSNYNCNNATLVACGRYAENIIPYCDNEFVLIPTLTLEGLNNIYILNRG